VRCGEPGSPAKAEKKMPPPSAGASEEVSIKCGGDTLVGVLHLPKNAAPHPAIIFIHGDGPTDHAAGGYYEPIWEEFLKAGYACLSWDKPGVGKSTNASGHYVPQSYYQRASELRRALDYLKTRKHIDPKRIGCWGISQAAWIMPMVASRSKDIAFLIAVSCPGQTALEQSTYLQRCRLPSISGLLGLCHLWLTSLLAPNPKPADGFWKHLEGSNPGYMTKHDLVSDGSYFIDPVPFLEKTTCPVLAIFGAKDRNVEPVSSARVYREALKKAGNQQVTITTFPDADHILYVTKTGSVKEMRMSSKQNPRPYVPGYLDAMSQWLKDLEQAQRPKE
jgi:hypothetical protein